LWGHCYDFGELLHKKERLPEQEDVNVLIGPFFGAMSQQSTGREANDGTKRCCQCRLQHIAQRDAGPDGT
jgi:hypothetical protein